MGRMFLTMIAAFAELERNMIAERTQAALDPCLIQGVYGVSEEAVQFQSDGMPDTLGGHGPGNLLPAWPTSQRLRRHYSSSRITSTRQRPLIWQ
jgi:resolvase-like protein